MQRRSRIGIAVASTIAFVALGTLASTVASGQDALPAGDAGSTAQDAKTVVTTNRENTYVPVTPCRIVDGREALGVIPAGGNRSYEVRGTTGFVPQGGHSGGCGIPTYATAVTFSVTVVNPSGGGFLRAWPQGQGEPNATLMNIVGGQSQTTTAPLTLGATSEAKDIRFKSYATGSMLVIDVQGFYAPQIEGHLGLTGGLANTTSRVLSSTHPAVGHTIVTIDRDVSSCSATASPDGSGNYIISAVTNANKVDLYSYRADTAAATNIVSSFSVTC